MFFLLQKESAIQNSLDIEERILEEILQIGRASCRERV